MKLLRRHHAHECEDSLLQRTANWPHLASLETLSPGNLKQVSKSQGVDFATALLFDRFRKSPRHAEFINRLNALERDAVTEYPSINAKVVIVPGALYLERPEMGGDGRLVREVAANFGCATDLIPIASFGSVETNASLIRRWLEQHPQERLILVSLSKGGLDLKAALVAMQAPSVYGNIVAWINVCGPLNGSQIANWILASRWRTSFVRAKCLWQRRDFKFVTDLRHTSDGMLNHSPWLPATIKLYNLVGFPLHRHMTTPFSRFCHRILAAEGPNDGTTTLSDLITWPGEVFPVWSMDHYFRPEQAAKRLITTMFRYLAEQFPSLR